MHSAIEAIMKWEELFDGKLYMPICYLELETLLTNNNNLTL
jgi:hypothetical protein